MTDSSLLIIHQGALGDVVMTFPALIALRKKFGRIDILCQGQLGKLAAGLGLVDKAYPLEAAYVATLFSKSVDKKIKTILAAYSTILLFSFVSDLKKSTRQISKGRCFQLPPRPPVREKINVTEFILKNLFNCGLLEACNSDDRHFTRQGRLFPDTARPVDSSKIFIHPGARSIRKPRVANAIVMSGFSRLKKQNAAKQRGGVA